MTSPAHSPNELPGAAPADPEGVADQSQGTETQGHRTIEDIGAAVARIETAVDELTDAFRPRKTAQTDEPETPDWGPGQRPITFVGRAAPVKPAGDPRPVSVEKLIELSYAPVVDKQHRRVAIARQEIAKREGARPVGRVRRIMRGIVWAVNASIDFMDKGTDWMGRWDDQIGFMDTRGRTGPRNIVGRRRQQYPYK